MLDTNPRVMSAEDYNLLCNFAEITIRRLEERDFKKLKVIAKPSARNGICHSCRWQKDVVMCLYASRSGLMHFPMRSYFVHRAAEGHLPGNARRCQSQNYQLPCRAIRSCCALPPN